MRLRAVSKSRKEPSDQIVIADVKVSKTKKKKNRRLISSSTYEVASEVPSPQVDRAKKPSLSIYQQNLLNRLRGSRFRMLNEEFYKTTGEEMQKKFQCEPSAFEEYHHGYKLQEKGWRTNPTSLIIDWLKTIPAKFIVADLGCGEARIAKAFPKRKIYSFDLVSVDNSIVIAADISSVPLPSQSIDVSIFCLSLMGVNWSQYLAEGTRILKVMGILKIAEVQSRFTNLQLFIKKTNTLGYKLTKQENIDNYFQILEFQKIEKKSISILPSSLLSHCHYKKR